MDSRSGNIKIRPLFEEGLTAAERRERERLVSTRSARLLREVIKWVRPNTNWIDATKIVGWFKYKRVDDPFPWPCEFLHDEVGLLLPILSNGRDDVTFTDENGRTILHLCILHYMRDGGHSKYNFSERNKQHEDTRIVRKFIVMGASIITPDNDGQTPLGLAIEKQRIDLVLAMLKCLDPMTHALIVNDHGQTVLRVLTEHCNYTGRQCEYYVDAIVRWSEPRGALTRPDARGLTPLHLIVKYFHVQLLERFDNSDYEVNCRDVRVTSEGDDLVIFACKHINAATSSDNHLFVIDWLLKRGCNADGKNHGGFSALHYALQSRNLTVIKSLLEAGADPHAVAADGTNALHPAAMLSSYEVMQHFVVSGVESHCRDTAYGFTLMHMAALSPDEGKFEWLVDVGFELDDPGTRGVTPLHLASMVGNAGVVRKLIDRGANVHSRDLTWRCTPLHLAAMRGGFLTIRDFKDDDEQSSLIAHCFDLLDFKTNSKTDYKSVVVALLESGAEVNATDTCGRTPLHYATRRLFGNIDEILLMAGARVDAQDAEGFTPLHHCLIVGWGLDTLIAFGADINDVEHPRWDVLGEIASEKNEHKCYAISKQMKKMRAAGLAMSDACGTWNDELGDKDMLWYVRGECQKEVLLMKKEMLTDVEVSLYDLLHMRSKRRLAFIDRLPADLHRKFPFFYPMIRGCCHEAVVRVSLLKSAEEAYQLLTGYHWPDLCVDYICSFLNNKSLRALIDSVSDMYTDCIGLEKLSI